MNEECPLCGAEIELHFVPYKIPIFGEIMITTAVCSSCGYHTTDVMVLTEGKKRRYETVISSADDLNAIVIRSPFGTITIPELYVTVEPKRGDAFISSVEGVLNRVEGVVKMLAREVEGTGKERAETVLDQIDRIKAGKASMTLIIDDPTGNSAIIPNNLFFSKNSFTKEIKI